MAGKLYLGSMGWSYGFWGLYRGLKPEEYLGEYARRFNSVEINSTFYRILRWETVESWAAAGMLSNIKASYTRARCKYLLLRLRLGWDMCKS
jgi:hypothetical protein